MNLSETTLATLEDIKKAQTSGFTSSTGVTGYDLADLVSQIPVNTPFRDRLSRVGAEQGSKTAYWRALLNINSSQPNPGTAFDYAAALSLVSELDVSAPYAKIGAGWTATVDAEAFARGYADVKAKAVWNAMNQFKIAEDKKAIGGCAFSLGTPATPVVTVTSTTAGTIAASTAVNVKVAARTGTNYFWGGSTVASSQGTVTTGTTTSTNQATATVTAVRGAVAYDWYVAGFYYTTTTVNKVVISSIPTANAGSVPTSGLPGLYSTAPTAVPTADSSATTTDFNGILASLAGDYNNSGTGLVTPGTGTSSGAYFGSLDGGAFTVSGEDIAELDTMNQAIYDSVQQSPDVYMVSSRQGAEISKAQLSGGAGTTFFQPNLAGRNAATLGAFVGFYVNKAAGGTPIAIEVNPNLPPGTLIARTDQVLFPDSGIGRVCEIRTQMDVTNWDYPAARVASTAGGGPRWDGEVFATETFINYAPTTMGVLQNIA